MLISQLYRSNPDLNEVGFKILENWYKQTTKEKYDNLKWLAEELRKNRPGREIAVALAGRLGVNIADNFPPAQPAAGVKGTKMPGRGRTRT